MSVPFTDINFQNTASVPVTLTIEAPAGNVIVSAQNVDANSTYHTDPVVSDCLSVVFRVVSSADPNEESQAFSVNPPLSLQTIGVSYFIGSFQATVAAKTA